ncbi:MAG: M16 family metallopeptidase [Rhodomicrobiaceae bacterium]
MVLKPFQFTKPVVLFLLTVLALPFLNNEAFAMKVERVVSPLGIEAWLVQEKNVPLIAMQFAFNGGAAQDEVGKEGTAYLLSGMLDEGAGDLTSTQFQEKIEEIAIRLSFEASRDNFSGKFQTLSERKDEAFDLLKLAITQPRFDQDAIDRVRLQIISGLKFEENNPNNVATRTWFKNSFGEHPYARPTKGTETSLKALSQDDLKAVHKKIFSRENLKISVVGDISPEELGVLIDKVFGDLPLKSGVTDVPEAEPVFGPKVDNVIMGIPQSVVQFGHQGLKRDDKDFIPAYILNYIMGGGGFASRLMEEVREKRGLAYSVYSYLYPLKHSALVLGGVATKNSSVPEAMDLIKKEFSRMANDGPSEEELKNAKNYLTGSYALRFDTSSKIASQLLWIQVEGLGMDYIDKRNEMINAVSMSQIRDVAKRLFQGDKLRFVVVGQPIPEAPETQ